MNNFKKHTILKYLPRVISIEQNVNPLRVFAIRNDSNIKNINKGYIVYLCERELRVKDNFALQYCVELSKKYDLPLKILYPIAKFKNTKKDNFISFNANIIKKEFIKNNFDFTIISADETLNFINNNVSILILDFNPILDRTYLKNCQAKIIYEIDGHNIVPARFVSDKQEYNAATFRKKIYENIFPFFTKYDNKYNYTTQADTDLKYFIQNNLKLYELYKNNPLRNVTSGLSKYLNFGFISSQRVALEVIKSNASDENKEAYLEELIIRKELADNYCLYCNNFMKINCVPLWARNSLINHKNDIRTYIYSLINFENADTHDKLWNATQTQLRNEGTIQGYLRMYWAKKILEWSLSANEALNIAFYLNDKYAFDSPSPNGYVGILWSIAGLHDRAFKDYPITGKIRRMTYNSIKHKFDIQEYIDKYSKIID